MLIVGGRPRQINVVVDTAKLTAVGLTTAQLVAALQSQNVQIPGGKVEQGLRDLTLRTYGRVQSPQEFANIPLSTSQRLRRQSRRRRAHRRQRGRAGVDRHRRRQAGGRHEHPQAVGHEHRRSRQAAQGAARPRCSTDLPKGWTMRIVRDQSDYIVAAVDAVKEHLILGSLFAALIVWFFLSSPKLRVALIMLARDAGDVLRCCSA